MDRVAIFVDAGYWYAAGSAAIFGSGPTPTGNAAGAEIGG